MTLAHRHPASSICLGCRPGTASSVSVTCSSPMTAAPTASTGLSRTTRHRRLQSPSCGRHQPPFPSNWLMCRPATAAALPQPSPRSAPRSARSIAKLSLEHRRPTASPSASMAASCVKFMASTSIDARRQRVLAGRTPSQIVIGRLKAEPELANPAP